MQLFPNQVSELPAGTFFARVFGGPVLRSAPFFQKAISELPPCLPTLVQLATCWFQAPFRNADEVNPKLPQAWYMPCTVSSTKGMFTLSVWAIAESGWPSIGFMLTTMRPWQRLSVAKRACASASLLGQVIQQWHVSNIGMFPTDFEVSCTRSCYMLFSIFFWLLRHARFSEVIRMFCAFGISLQTKQGSIQFWVACKVGAAFRPDSVLPVVGGFSHVATCTA